MGYRLVALARRLVALLAVFGPPLFLLGVCVRAYLIHLHMGAIAFVNLVGGFALFALALAVERLMGIPQRAFAALRPAWGPPAPKATRYGEFLAGPSGVVGTYWALAARLKKPVPPSVFAGAAKVALCYYGGQLYAFAASTNPRDAAKLKGLLESAGCEVLSPSAASGVRLALAETSVTPPSEEADFVLVLERGNLAELQRRVEAERPLTRAFTGIPVKVAQYAVASSGSTHPIQPRAGARTYDLSELQLERYLALAEDVQFTSEPSSFLVYRRGARILAKKVAVPEKEHVLVVGATQSGKSVSLANFILYLAGRGKVLVFDWLGQFSPVVSKVRGGLVVELGRDAYLPLLELDAQRVVELLNEACFAAHGEDLTPAQKSKVLEAVREAQRKRSFSALLASLERIARTSEEASTAASAAIWRIQQIEPFHFTPLPTNENLLDLLESSNIVCVNMSAVPGDYAKALFAMLTLEFLMERWVARETLYLVVDEASRLAPRRGRAWILEKLASAARHYNIYLVCANQTIGDLSPRLVGNCTAKLYFRMASGDEVDAVRRDFASWKYKFPSEAPTSLADIVSAALQALPPGHAFLVRGKPVGVYIEYLELPPARRVVAPRIEEVAAKHGVSASDLRAALSELSPDEIAKALWLVGTGRDFAERRGGRTYRLVQDGKPTRLLAAVCEVKRLHLPELHAEAKPSAQVSEVAGVPQGAQSLPDREEG